MTAMNHGGAQRELIDGRFEPLQQLGGGGMGVVWRAYDTALDREVALKEVRPADPAIAAADPEGARTVRERVLREARALARLQHPNVVTIHHIIDTAEYPHPYLVMELVHGGSLADRLTSGPLGVPEAARIGRGVLAALRAAHAGGIQHRDVKPGNILLRADGTPVLTDFGIATLHDATALTAAGSLIGSPEYMAPERIRGHEGGPASDLWSLAMTLYVALEGRHPLRRSGTQSCASGRRALPAGRPRTGLPSRTRSTVDSLRSRSARSAPGGPFYLSLSLHQRYRPYAPPPATAACMRRVRPRVGHSDGSARVWTCCQQWWTCCSASRTAQEAASESDSADDAALPARGAVRGRTRLATRWIRFRSP